MVFGPSRLNQRDRHADVQGLHAGFRTKPYQAVLDLDDLENAPILSKRGRFDYLRAFQGFTQKDDSIRSVVRMPTFSSSYRPPLSKSEIP